MRFALLATSTLVALALASYACSSSDDSKPAAADAGKTSSSSSGKASGDDDDISSSSSSSSSGQSSSGSSSGQSSSSGDAAASSSGASSGTPIDGGDLGGTKCVTNDQIETAGDHSTQGAAQVLTATTGTAKTGFCGRLAAGETDFWSYTFTVDGMFSYSSGASFSSTAPTLTVITGGEEFPFTSIPNGKIKSGQAVIFKLVATTAVDYHVSFDVTKN